MVTPTKIFLEINITTKNTPRLIDNTLSTLSSIRPNERNLRINGKSVQSDINVTNDNTVFLSRLVYDITAPIVVT